MHYRFPSSFQRSEEGRPRGSVASRWAPPGVRTAPGAWLPGEPLGSPFFSPPEPTSPGSQALCLPQVFLAADCSVWLPPLGQEAPPGFSCRVPPSSPLPQKWCSPGPASGPFLGCCPLSHGALLGSLPRPEGGLCPLPLALGYLLLRPLPLFPALGRRQPIVPDSPSSPGVPSLPSPLSCS